MGVALMKITRSVSQEKDAIRKVISAIESR